MPSIVQSGGASFTYIGTSKEGYEIKETLHRQDVKDDLYGDARPDSIFQGVEYELAGINIEFDKLLQTGVAGPINTSAIYGGVVNEFVGYRMRDLAGSLCLTPMPNTPAAKRVNAANGGATNTSIVFYSAMLINDINVLLSSKLTEVPVTFALYPVGPTPAYTTGSPGTNAVWSYTTTPSGCAFTFAPASFT
jgi:hypothetical protein